MTSREAIFTIRELDVMAVLWDRGSGTVAEVRELLEDPLAYTTVLTVLRTLEEKGYVGHTDEGRAHRYHPLVTREQAQESHVRRLIRKLFQGSPAALIRRVVSLKDLSPEDSRELRALLDQTPD